MLHAATKKIGAYATLTEALAKPALAAVAQFSPLASNEIIDGFQAQSGLISQCYEGVLSDPAELKPLPFEIIFETPQTFAATAQVAAATAALGAILSEYRQFIAYGQNL